MMEKAKPEVAVLALLKYAVSLLSRLCRPSPDALRSRSRRSRSGPHRRRAAPSAATTDGLTARHRQDPRNPRDRRPCDLQVANAVYNASGIRVRELPITLDKLLREL